MNKYKILIEGRNCLVSVDDQPQKCGFFATRFAEAVDPSKAKNMVMDLIRNQLRDIVSNDQSDSPDMWVAAINEIDSFSNYSVPGSGFTWFSEDEEER